MQVFESSIRIVDFGIVGRRNSESIPLFHFRAFGYSTVNIIVASSWVVISNN